jgi:hypothetical protein
MYRIVCFRCGNAVTSDLPAPVIIEGHVECTTCSGQAASEMAKLLDEVRELTVKVEIQAKQIEQLNRPRKRRDIKIVREGG